MRPRRLRLLLLFAWLLMLSACAREPEVTPSSGAAGPTPEAARLQTVVLALKEKTPQGGAAWARETTEAVNLRLAELGTPLRLELRVLPEREPMPSGGDTFDEVVTGTAGEGVDLFLDDFGPRTRELAQSGYAVDISQTLLQYPALWGVTPERAWQETMIDGRIVCFPILRDYAGEESVAYRFRIHADVLAAMEAPIPQTPEELTTLLIRARENADVARQGLLCPFSTPPLALHRTYPEWPFAVDEQSRFVLYNDGTVGPYVGSEIFLRDCAYYRELSNRELLLATDEDIGGGAAVFLLESMVPSYALPPSELERYHLFASEGGSTRIGSCAYTAIYVSSRSRDVGAALAMLELLYTEASVTEALLGDENQAYALALAHGPTAEPTNPFAGSGFVLEEARLSNAQWADIDFVPVWALRAGMTPLDQLDAVIGALDAQGYPQMLAACQEQYTEYLERFGQK